MDANALVRRVDPEEFATLVVAGRISGSVAGALLSIPAGYARECLSAMPVLHQASITSQEICGGLEAAMLPLLSKDVALQTIMVDVAVFSKMDELDNWMDHFIHGQSIEEIAEATDRRTIRITDGSGKLIDIPIRVHPERVLVYLTTILCADSQSWREAMLEALGPEFLAYLLVAVEENVIVVDEDFMLELRVVVPEDYYYDAVRLSEHLSLESLEADLIELHSEAMRDAFAITPEMVGSKQTADQLVLELDLG